MPIRAVLPAATRQLAEPDAFLGGEVCSESETQFSPLTFMGGKQLALPWQRTEVRKIQHRMQ
jgi:hypothetical protein